MNLEILDADWYPTGDADLIRQRRELDAAFDHAARRQRAYDYMSRVEARGWRRVRRFFLGSLTFLGAALILALLVG